MTGATAIRVVTDSTADWAPGQADDAGVTVVPLRVIIGDAEYRDGVDITPGELYRRMASEPIRPRTSQPSPAEFAAVFSAAGADGATVICTTISSEMSGTYASAIAARDQLPDIPIHVVDTRTAALGHGHVARVAARAAAEGADVEGVLAAIDSVMRTQDLYFAVDSLEYLRRGGRIGGAQALLGSMLSIKPILAVREGRVEPFEKVRTYRRALERVRDRVAELAAAGPLVVGVAHADRAHEATELAATLQPHSIVDVTVSEVGPVVGCHAGPGALGVAMYRP